MEFIVSAAPAFAPKELVPAGPHIAICTQLIQIGTVTGFNRFRGEIETKPKVYLGFELCEVTHEYNGKTESRTISRRYNLTLHENSSLYADIISWRGKKFTEEELKGFNLMNIVGKPCVLNIQHEKGDEGKQYANIKGITPLHKSMPKPEQTLPTLTLAYGKGWDWDVFEGLPKYLKEIMEGTPEFKAIAKDRPGGALPAALAAEQAKAEAPKTAALAADTGDDNADLPF